MAKFKVGDRAKVLDRPNWPGGYKIANWEGKIVEVRGGPSRLCHYESRQDRL